MSVSQCVTYASGQGVSDNTTRYLPITGYLFANSVIDYPEIPVRDAGSFSNLYTYAHTNTTGVTSVLTLLKSQVATALTVSYTSGQTGIKEDTSNSVAFANTDEVEYSVAVPTEAGTTTITLSVMAVNFTPDTSTNTISFLITQGASTDASASTTKFQSPEGILASPSTTTEANTKLRIRASVVFSDLYTYVSSNSRTTNTSYGTRKNGAAGSQIVTYTSGQTGVKEDASNTDSLVATDDYNYYITTSTGTENIILRVISTTGINTAGFFIMESSNSEGTGVGFGSTNYIGTSGRLQLTATEANAQTLARFTYVASELASYVSANTSNGTTDIHIRDNGGNSSVTVQYTTTQTGLKNDTSNTTTITSGTDEINYGIVDGGSSGTVTFMWVSCMGKAAGTSIKTKKGLVYASVKTFKGLVTASVKTDKGLA